ncbi:PKD domain-containing protein [Natrialbaceae archaeon A-gly3]
MGHLTTATGIQDGGGPVFLTGIDAEDGGVGGHGPISIYVDVVESILEQVTNDGAGILVIGEEAVDTPNEVTQFWDEIGEQVEEDVTYIGGTSAIRQQSFDPFAMVAVVSAAGAMGGPDPDPGIAEAEGLTDLENEALIDRSGDIAAFVNAGGGLLGSSQGYIDPPELTTPWGYVGDLGDFETEVGLGYERIDPTDEGAEIGITTDLNVCCWHDVFLDFPGFLDVLAVHDDRDEPHYGEPAAIGGTLFLPDVTIEIEGPAVVDIGDVEEYDVRIANTGDDIPENISLEFDLDHDDDLETGDVTLEYFDEDDDAWRPVQLDIDDGVLSGAVWAVEGVPLLGGTEETLRLRLSFDAVHEFVLTAMVVGVDTGDDYARTEHRIREPAAQFTYEPEDPVAGESIEFDASESEALDGQITDYRWDVTGDDEIDLEGEVVEHAFDEEGVYEVTLTVVDDRGGDDETQRTVSVEEDEVFGTLRADKLEKAGVIDELAVTDIQDRSAIESRLSEFETAIGGGSVERDDAASAVERMLIGEGLTEIALAYSGDDEADVLRDYDLTGSITRPMLRTAVNIILLKSAIAQKIRDKVTYLRGLVDSAIEMIDNALNRFIDAMIGVTTVANQTAHAEALELADTVYFEIATGALETVEEIEERIDTLLDPAVEAVGVGLRMYIERAAPAVGHDGVTTGISGSLAHLHEGLGVSTVEDGLAGDYDGAWSARQRGLSSLNDSIGRAHRTLGTLEDLADGVDAVVEVVGIVDETIGLSESVRAVVSLVREIANMVFDAIGAGTGLAAMHQLTSANYRGIEGIVQGEPSG